MHERHDSETTTLLLTGFGPFPGVKDNASARLVEHLAPLARQELRKAEHSVTGHIDVHSAILPTEWQRAPETLRDLIETYQPDLSLHFGVAREAQGFHIETRAANACRLEDDAAGLRPAAEWLHPKGAAFRRVTIPAQEIAARLTALGFPASLSNDAGAYLCNAVLYHALAPSRAHHKPRRAGFIHIPVSLDGPPLTFNQALSGALEIARISLSPLLHLTGRGLG